MRRISIAVIVIGCVLSLPLFLHAAEMDDVRDCVEDLAANTGSLDKAKGKTVEIDYTQHMDFVKKDLRFYAMGADPSVTAAQKECAAKVLDYLNSDVSDEEKQSLAELYMSSYLEANT